MTDASRALSRPDEQPADRLGLPVGGAPVPGSNGHLARLPEEPPRSTRLLRYLPAIYAGDDFATRFLGIFEAILDPLEELVQNQPYYFDPTSTPPELLDFFAEWVALHEGADWPEAQRRALITRIVPIYGVRGTLQAVKLHLEALNGVTALVQENTDGFRLSADARLGLNTGLGHARPAHFTVTLLTADPTVLDTDTLDRLIAAEQPVGTTFTVHLLPNGET